MIVGYPTFASVQAYYAAGAGSVLHHDRLANQPRQRLPDHAADAVGWAARRKGNDQADGPRRPGFRRAERKRRGQDCGASVLIP